MREPTPSGALDTPTPESHLVSHSLLTPGCIVGWPSSTTPSRKYIQAFVRSEKDNFYFLNKLFRCKDTGAIRYNEVAEPRSHSLHATFRLSAKGCVDEVIKC